MYKAFNKTLALSKALSKALKKDLICLDYFKGARALSKGSKAHDKARY